MENINKVIEELKTVLKERITSCERDDSGKDRALCSNIITIKVPPTTTDVYSVCGIYDDFIRMSYAGVICYEKWFPSMIDLNFTVSHDGQIVGTAIKDTVKESFEATITKEEVDALTNAILVGCI